MNHGMQAAESLTAAAAVSGRGCATATEAPRGSVLGNAVALSANIADTLSAAENRLVALLARLRGPVPVGGGTQPGDPQRTRPEGVIQGLDANFTRCTTSTERIHQLLSEIEQIA